jgi:FMN phosphatase YigB (HAD superfamily)
MARSSVIRGIFFDANGIIYHRLESLSRYVRDLMRLHGYAPELTQEDAASLQQLEARASIGAITHWDYWDERLRRHGVADVEERRALTRRILRQVHRVVPLPDVSEVFRALKQRGFLLGVISNTMYPLRWKMWWLRRAGVARFIDITSSSTEVHAAKPDPAIYLDALARATMRASEAAFVGHDDDELIGARGVGMVTVAVRPEGGTIVDYEVRQLIDLLTLPLFAWPR